GGRGRRRGGHGRPGMAPRGGGGGSRAKPLGLATRLFVDDGVLIGISADRSVFIASAVNEVRNTAIYGGLLAIVVLFLFLKDIRSTAIIALSIPVSLLVTFAPLNMLGVSLNIMSLGGLALGVGMLVDSSIVVLESIARCREEGDGVVASAVRGTAEVRNAVAASTFTSIAVFFPMVFVEGVAGQAFGDLGMAVVISLLASLVVAVLLIPMLASRRGLDLEAVSTAPALRRFAAWRAFRNDFESWPPWLRWPGLAYLVPRFLLGTFFELLGKAALLLLAGGLLAWKRAIGPVVTTTLRLLTRPLLALSTTILETIQRAYPRGIRWALGHPIAILALALAAMVGTVFAMTGLDSELLPTVHQGEFTVEVTLPVGTPLEETDAMLRPVERTILAHRQHIERLLMTVGYDPTNMKRSDEGENTARFKVILDTADPAVERTVADRIRALVADVPDAESRVVRPVLFSFRTPIEVDVYGHDLIRLQRTAERVRQLMSGLPELADVETTQRKGAPEVQIVYDRDRLIRAGLDIETVAQEVQAAVKGDEATRFNLTDRRVPIVVRYALPYRRTVEDIRRIIVNPGGDRPIPLAAVAKVLVAEGPSEVRRVDGRRVAMVTANIAHGSLGHAVERIRRLLGSKMTWPSDMSFFIAGQSEEWARSRKSLLLAMALAIFLVYAIMAAQFESLLQPLVIMLSIPLAFFGSALALHLLHISLSVVVFLGMIMLAGIVVNNAIVLVDYINTLRGRGVPRDEAIVTAGSVRLRPILMTTATTVLGLLPMAVGLGDGAELRSPMAVTVIAGLLTSTLLTLVVVPSFYQVLERAVDRFRRSTTAVPEAEPSREIRH
ncbi:MAG: efflux RND transporter permease subunit, partial [Acidobacteria bacterium]|nr:efflux RND transporter permease subunit [Acidobacteriota bacterium]